jgi:hypothetical protein
VFLVSAGHCRVRETLILQIFFLFFVISRRNVEFYFKLIQRVSVLSLVDTAESRNINIANRTFSSSSSSESCPQCRDLFQTHSPCFWSQLDIAESRNINIANRTFSSSFSAESCPQCRDLFPIHSTCFWSQLDTAESRNKKY